jgi:molybdate transport system substrate-binding protein
MRLAAILAVAVAVLCAGCGDDPELTVSAATSLKAPFTEYADGYGRADVRLSFAGSDQLATQIRAGARPDVFASASIFLLRKLAEEGLVEPPVEFAYNTLVVAVRRDGRVQRLQDLGEPGVKIAIGRSSVPVGGYARNALKQIPVRLGRRIVANLASQEPDAAAVIGRVRAGAVDAGFAYRSDVSALGELRGIRVPADVRPAYAAAVVAGSKHAEEARTFVRLLGSPRARDALADAGFELPQP